MKKLLVLASACAAMVSFSLKGDLAWDFGSYTDWSPSDKNILAGLTAMFSGEWYQEGGQAQTSQDPATLTDGVVVTTPKSNSDMKNAGDYGKICGVKANSKLTWTFDTAYEIEMLKVFTRWGDGGRDGVGIGKVEVSGDYGATWTDIGAQVSTYGNGDNNTSGALYGCLKNEAAGKIASSVTALRITFGVQDNSGAGYVEIEATSAEDLQPTAATGEFTPAVLGGASQTFAAKVTSYGRFSSSATMTMELSTDADFTSVISSNPIALSGDGDLNAEKSLTVSGLQPATLYYSRLKVVNEKELTFVSEAQQYSTIDTLVCLGIGYVPTETGVRASVVISSMDAASATIKLFANSVLVESRDISAAGNYDFDVISSASAVAFMARISYDGKTVTKEATAQKGASGYVLSEPADHASVATSIKMKPGDTITMPPVLAPARYAVLNQSFLSQQDNVFTAIKPGIVGIEVYGADGTLATTMAVIVLPEKIGNGNIYIKKDTSETWGSASAWLNVDGAAATDYPHLADDIAIIPDSATWKCYMPIPTGAVLGGLYFGRFVNTEGGVVLRNNSLTFRRTDGKPVMIQACSNSRVSGKSSAGIQFGDGATDFIYESDTVFDGGWDGVDPEYTSCALTYKENSFHELKAGVTLSYVNFTSKGTSMSCTFTAPPLKGAGTIWNRSAANIRYEKASPDFTGAVRDSSHGNGNVDRSGPTFFYGGVSVPNASAEVYGFVSVSSSGPDCSTAGVGMLCTGWDGWSYPGYHEDYFPGCGLTMVNGAFRCGSTESGSWGVGVAEVKHTSKFSVGRGFSYIYRQTNRSNAGGHPINWFETDALVHTDKGTIQIDDYYRSARDADPGTSTNNVTILHGFNALAVGGTGDSQTEKNNPILPWAVSPSKHTGKLDFLCVDANERVCDRYAVDEKPSDVPSGEDANVYTWQKDLALSESKVFNALTICNNTKLKTMGAGKTLTLTSGGLILLQNTSSIGTKTGGEENGALVLGDATKPGYVYALSTDPNDPNCVYAPTTAQGGLVFGYTGYALLAGDQTGVDDELVVNAGTLDLGSQDKSVACTLDVPVRILANAKVKLNNVAMRDSDIYFDDIAGYGGKIELNADESKCQKLYVRDTPEETEWTSLRRGTYGATGSGADNIDDERFSGPGVLTVRKDDLEYGLLIIVR